jgi:hypothetical protein
MFSLVLFGLSVDVFIGVVFSETTPIHTSTDRQSNTNTDINRWTKQRQ